MRLPYYDPTTGRFLSADPILVLGDDQQINGYAYAHNNPTSLTDPTGLCASDGHNLCSTDAHHDYVLPPPSRSQPRPNPRVLERESTAGGGGSTANNFVGCNAVALNCTVEQIDAMNVDDRKALVLAWTELYLRGMRVGDQYQNIIGVLDFMIDLGFGQSGSWSSWVDSVILHAIQGGIAILNNIGGGMGNPGARLWVEYFRYVESGGSPSSDAGRRRWSEAEQAATEHGYDVANQRGTSATLSEWAFSTGAEAYRWGMRNMGPVRTTADALCGPVCARGVDWFLDPSNREPTYYGGHVVVSVVGMFCDTPWC